MDTDKQLYKLFGIAPEQLYVLLGLDPPAAMHARSEIFKELETQSDLVVEPETEELPALLIEFQGYRDKSFIARTMLRCALYRMRHPSRAIRCHVVYLDRQFESVDIDDAGLFQPRVSYLPDLVADLELRFPDSPFLSVLRPLLVENEVELAATAVDDYERIKASSRLTDMQRDAWLDVFHSWLMTRLQLSLKEIRAMVMSRLPDVEELPWGRELKQQWTTQGRAAELRQNIARTESQLEHLEQLHQTGAVSDAVYNDLKDRAEQDLAQMRKRLDELGGCASVPEA